MKKKKGFTLVELLVVIAIIALLMGILMPALARVRQIAYRMVSGTNQAGIGKAMLIYANDNNGDYPVAGSRTPFPTTAAKILKWDGVDRAAAYTGYDPTNLTVRSDITIGSCFYLLIKYADVAPKQFINKSDVGSKEFKLTDYTSGPNIDDLTDAWDFGENPAIHVSYSYSYPFRDGRYYFPVTQQSNPSAPVVGDRNPYLDKNATHINEPITVYEDPKWDNNQFVDTDGKANTACHQRDGQNVLFNDMHVRFEKLSNCGVNNDNIYLCWGVAATGGTTVSPQIKQLGGATWTKMPLTGFSTPAQSSWNEDDAFLVSDRK